MNFSKFFRAFLVLLLIFSTGCSQKSAPNFQDSENFPQENSIGLPIKIVTTTPPLYSLTSKLIKGTDVLVSNLVPGNISEHTYQLTPDDMRLLQDADIVVINGLELEEFLEPVLNELEAAVVDSSEDVALLENAGRDEVKTDEVKTDEKKEPEGNGKNEHGFFNPHIWLSPANAKIQAGNILRELEKADEAESPLYKENYAALAVELDQLEANIRTRLGALKIEPYVVFHNAYAYFENDFGIRAAAYLEEFPGKEPSAEYLKEVIDIIEEKRARVIFTEPQFSPKLAETLANDYGLTIETLDPLGQRLTEDGYFEMMESNIAALERAFGK